MAVPDNDFLSDIRSSVSTLVLPPATKRRLSRSAFDEGDRAVWRKHGFEEIYLKRCKHEEFSSEWAAIKGILNNPTIRLTIDCQIAAHIPAAELMTMIEVLYSLKITEQTLGLYQKYFFDVSGMKKSDWVEYLQFLREDTYSFTRLYTALTKPKDELLYMLGLPNKKQFADFLRTVLSTADYKFKYYSRQTGDIAEAEARKWASVGINAGVRYDKYAGQDAGDFASLIQTSFEYIDQEIPTIKPEMIADIKPVIENVSQKGPDAPIPIGAGELPKQDNEAI